MQKAKQRNTSPIEFDSDAVILADYECTVNLVLENVVCVAVEEGVEFCFLSLQPASLRARNCHILASH